MEPGALARGVVSDTKLSTSGASICKLLALFLGPATNTRARAPGSTLQTK